MIRKKPFVFLILAILLSISIKPVQAAGPWIGSKELEYAGVLNIDLGIFFTPNQTLYWSFTSTSENVNISIYKFVNFADGGGVSTFLDHGIAEGQGSFILETYLNYSIRFAHVDWDHKEENATVTAVITDTVPNTASTIQTNTANLTTGIIFTALIFIGYNKKRKRRN